MSIKHVLEDPKRFTGVTWSPPPCWQPRLSGSPQDSAGGSRIHHRDLRGHHRSKCTGVCQGPQRHLGRVCPDGLRSAGPCGRRPSETQACGGHEASTWGMALGGRSQLPGPWDAGDDTCPSRQLSKCGRFAGFKSKTSHYCFLRQRPPEDIRS